MIKQVSRNLPETNSSSSHTIVIDTEEVELIDKNLYKLDIVDGIIHIISDNSRLEFGRDFGKYKDLYSKILYACSLIHAYNYNIENIFKDLSLVKELILEFTGEKDVVFDWIPEFYSRLEKIKSEINFNDLESVEELDYLDQEDFNIPGIDHQSIEKYQEIFENRDTLKNFLFNKNSWFITSDDGIELSESLLYDELSDKISGGKIIIHIGEDIGDIHHEFDEFPTTLSKELNNSTLYDDNITQTMLKSIIFNSNHKRIVRDDNNINNLYYIGIINNKLNWSTKNWLESYNRDLYTNPNLDENVRLKNIDNLFPKERLEKLCEIYSNEFGLC